MKSFKSFMTVFVMSVIVISCSNLPSEKEVQDVKFESADTSAIESFNSPQTGNDKQEERDTNKEKNNQPAKNNTTSNNVDWDKKIIKTADFELELNDYKDFNSNIHNSIKKFGAYIANEKQQQTDYKLENTITVKVPVAQFDDLVNGIAGEGIKIVQKNISGEDVTGEVVDTKARLQSKLAVREQYLQLLKQAKNMKDILQVQNEINEIQENIEAADGRINYLQHSAAYSTINIYYYQYINGSTSNDEKPDFFTKLLSAFSTGTSIISNLALFVISIWPLLVIGIIVWVYFRRIKLRKTAKA